MNKYKATLLFLLFSCKIVSQQAEDVSFINYSLEKALQLLEQQFEVKFSYNAATFANKKITSECMQCTLAQVIDDIERELTLKFEKINDRYYYIVVDQQLIDFSNHHKLDEVLITNYLTLGINKEKNGAIRISNNKLGLLPGHTEPDVLESLQILPSVQSPNETATGLYINGGTPDQNLILWDAIKIYNSGHFFGMISAFNPFITKEVTLSKAGASVKYGNRVSGVIDITSKAPSNKITGGIGLNMTHADAFIQAPISKKTSVLISARRSFTDVVETNTFTKLSDRVFQNLTLVQENQTIEGEGVLTHTTDFYFRDLSLKIATELSPRSNISISAINTKNNLSYLSDFKYDNDLNINDNFTSDLNIKNAGYSIQSNHRFSKKIALHTKSYYSNYKLNYQGNTNYTDTYSERFTKKNKVEDVGTTISLDIKNDTQNKYTFGYQVEHNNVSFLLEAVDLDETLFTEKNNNTIVMHSLFAERQYASDKWFLHGGIRANYYTSINSFIAAPRLNVSYTFAKNLSFKTTYEHRSQSISKIVEFDTATFGFGLENQLWALSNEDEGIPLQKSKQITTGFTYNASNLKIDIEGFGKQTTGLTSFTKGFNDETTDFSEGKNRVLGVHFLINKKIDNYRTWLGYSFALNKVKFIDFDTRYFPFNSDVTHNLSWNHAYHLKNFEFSLGWRIRTGTPYTKATDITIEDDELYIEYNTINANRLPNYHRLDFSMRYQIQLTKDNKHRMYIGFTLLNLYNQQNILTKNYTAKPYIDANNEVDYLLQENNKIALGLTPNFMLRYSF